MLFEDTFSSKKYRGLIFIMVQKRWKRSFWAAFFFFRQGGPDGADIHSGRMLMGCIPVDPRHGSGVPRRHLRVSPPTTPHGVPRAGRGVPRWPVPRPPPPWRCRSRSPSRTTARRPSPCGCSGAARPPPGAEPTHTSPTPRPLSPGGGDPDECHTHRRNPLPVGYVLALRRPSHRVWRSKVPQASRIRSCFLSHMTLCFGYSTEVWAYLCTKCMFCIF